MLATNYMYNPLWANLKQHENGTMIKGTINDTH